MSLKFFADQCVPSSIIQNLKNSGNEILKLSDYIPQNSIDRIVINKAQELNAILLSLNGDFSNIINYPPTDFKGIISLQIKNHPEIIPEMMNKLNKFISTHSEMKYYAGKLVLVEVHRIRIKLG
jgi:predicted nuclease of predicted toxin-antitoxin system